MAVGDITTSRNDSATFLSMKSIYSPHLNISRIKKENLNKFNTCKTVGC